MKKIIKVLVLVLLVAITSACSSTKKYDISDKFTINVPKKYTLKNESEEYDFYDSNDNKVLNASYVDGESGYFFVALAVTNSEDLSEINVDGTKMAIATIFDSVKVIFNTGDTLKTELSNKNSSAYLITNVGMSDDEFDGVIKSFHLK